ncbi:MULTISPECIES: hypothetical protein [Empedobacter]|uniref:Uncharacterized protein n=1 Tax=Empedobacter falsenii TaxID=343874 RepID=A0A3R8TMR0_9FLAO|nr:MULTISPECIES: hypothetical protein [Empedobacter]MDH0675600.1 hypothetical protein [Empedobacter sp. GD03861]RRT86375.1 hypothetical protein EGI88_14830 [Empedobacter falsenii]RRT87420.1 hypothetical protein EGI89_14770 [Empedobacter falsenii]
MAVANEYFWHTTRIILDESRNSKSMKDLQERLSKRGIQMKVSHRSNALRNYNITFKNQRGFKLDSVKGKDRVFTDMVRKNIKQNSADLQKAKELQNKPQYSRFAEIIKNRELKTSLEAGRMFNNKGLSR